MAKEKKLVIIESPAKARSLRSYLGKEYEIEASNGHVRDLPRNYLGVDTDADFKPTYTILPEKRKTVAHLKKKARGFSRIYLAADPDREGEAICWHLSQILEREGVTFSRLRFNAITRETVLKSLKRPSRIDMHLVDAQQARRVMDTLVGYTSSSWLQRLMGRGRSAGRVQSVALRMIKEREDEITEFVPVEYWKVSAQFVQGDTAFTADLHRIDGSVTGKPGKYPSSEKQAGEVLERLGDDEIKWMVSGLKEKKRSVKPPPPFITSTLQQTASGRLRYSPSRTMSIAQQLYEGMALNGGERTGLITYMRTDSFRMSPESLKKCRSYLSGEYGNEMLHSKPRRYRSKKGSQDAHEAIRPVDITLRPEKLTGLRTAPQHALHTLIWNRFAATQLKNATVVKTTVDVTGEELQFRTTGEKIAEKGFSVLDEKFVRLEKELPGLKKGSVILGKVEPQQQFTSPPPRFSEARLVAEMKKVGIGRPSTYVSTIATLKKRNYVEKYKGTLKPTELGCTTVDILVKMFPHIFQVDFTAKMEDLLDHIAKGSDTYSDVLKQLNVPLESSMEKANRNTEKLKNQLTEETGEQCPECGAPIVIRWGKYGKFKACSGFPQCRYSSPLEDDEPQEYKGKHCPECGGRLLIKSGRYGRYLGCSSHPKCKHTEPVPAGVACPEEGCSGELVEKRTRRGRIFFGCSRYPDCKYAVWNRPLDRECPRCGFPLLVEKKKGVWCPRCKKKIQD